MFNFPNLAPTENLCNGWADPLDGCPEPVWHADGYCYDVNNIEACNWDGGDNNNYACAHFPHFLQSKK